MDPWEESPFGTAGQNRGECTARLRRRYNPQAEGQEPVEALGLGLVVGLELGPEPVAELAVVQALVAGQGQG